jgi:hypothetical protein
MSAAICGGENQLKSSATEGSSMMNFMNLLRSRPTLIANLTALVVAAVVVVEGAYIVHECRGYYRPQDAPVFFAPAIVMFIIRNRTFSFIFLSLYLALSIQMLHQARSIHLVPDACGSRLDGPLEFMPLFFLASVVCLAVYAVGALVSLAASKVGK